jgi:hypothetical protein
MNSLLWLFIGLLWLGLIGWLRQREQQRSAEGQPSGRYLDILAGGVLFLLTLGFFWRTLSGDVYQPADGGDLVSFLFPTYRFAASQLQQGVLPLWNPHLYGGAPFISDIQAGFLYPPNLLLFLIQPDFGYRAMQWLAIGHIYWAGLGVYVLLRTLPLNDGRPVMRPAALLGALAFQLSDPLLIHLGNLNLIAVLSWLPWVLAAYHVGLARRNLRWTVLAALLFTVANYAGHAQSTLYIGLAIGIYTLVWWVQGIGDWRLEIGPPAQRGSFIKSLISNPQYPVLVLILTGLLTAPILLPALELTQYTERSDFTYQDTVGFSLAPTQALGILTPGFFGHGPALHWGLWQRVETPYAGVATVILALAGLVLVDARRRRHLWPWLALAVIGLITALGIYAIFHGWLTLLIPGFDQLRAPARALILWTLGLAVLAAAGLDSLAQNGGAPPLARSTSYATLHAVFKIVAFILAGIATPLLYTALLLTQHDETSFLRASVAALAITLATGFWLATWVLIQARRAAWISAGVFCTLMIGLLFFDLSATSAYTDISPSDPTVGYQHPEIVEFLQRDPELFRIDTRTDIEGLWQPDTAALVGLQDVGGIANPLILRHWQTLWENTGGRQTRQYDMLNVKYVLVRDGTPLPEEKFELALDAPGELSVYQNRDFLARAWLADGQGDLNMLTPLLEAQAAPITAYSNHAISVQVQAVAPSYLVLSEVWYPGWQATVNGTPAPVLQVNGGLRAVAVPSGQSIVQLWFAPNGWRIGLLLFAVGLILMAALLVTGKRSKR